MSITYTSAVKNQDLNFLQNPCEVKTFNDYKTLDDDHDSRFMFDQQSLSGEKEVGKKQIYGESRCHFIHNLQHHGEGW